MTKCGVCGTTTNDHMGDCHFGWHNPNTCPGPKSLLPPNMCVICYHDIHPNAICKAIDGYYLEMTGKYVACNCFESVSQEQRGNIIIKLEK